MCRPGATGTCRACQSSRCRSRASVAATSTSAKSRARGAGPGRAGTPVRLAVNSSRPVGLVVAQPQPGRRAEVGRHHAVLGEAEAARSRRRARANASPRAGAKSANTATEVSAGPGRPSRPRRARRGPAGARPRPVPACSAAARAARQLVGKRLEVKAERVTDAGRAVPSAPPTIAITVTRRTGGLTVGGQGVAGPAQVGGAPVVHDHDAAVGPGQRQRPLDELLRRRPVIGRPPACVLRMLTPRKSAAGSRGRPRRPGPAGPCRS